MTEIDWDVVEELEELSSPGESFVNTQLERFNKAWELTMPQLKQAVASSDAEMIFQLGHKLKSSCGVLGAISGERLCKDIEMAGRSNSLENITQDFDKLCREVTAIQESLSQFVRERASQAG